MIKILSLNQKPNFLHFSSGMLEGCRFTPEQINQAACDIAKQVVGRDIVSKRTLHLLKFSGSMTFPCFVNNACRFIPRWPKKTEPWWLEASPKPRRTHTRRLREYLQNHPTSPTFCLYDSLDSIDEIYRVRKNPN